jgi:hypothetical protein
MFALWIATVLSAVYSGGLLGGRATVRTIDPTLAFVSIHVGSRPVIANGTAVIRTDGTLGIDSETNERLVARGIHIEQITIETSRIRVLARLPILGTRTVILQEE